MLKQFLTVCPLYFASDKSFDLIFQSFYNINYIKTINNFFPLFSAQEKDFHLKTLTELLDLDIQELMKWLCHRRIISMRETFDKDMNMNEVSFYFLLEHYSDYHFNS